LEAAIIRTPMDTEWLDWLRILAAFAVVALHVSDNLAGSKQELASVWWESNLLDAAVRWCVPVFVMVSGALLLKARTPEAAPVFFRKRLRRILLPTVFWTLFYMVIWIRFGKGITLSKESWNVLTGHPFFHLWYLYMLFGLYLITPFLRTYMAGARRSEVRVLLIVLFGISAIDCFWNHCAVSPSDGPFITLFLPFIGYYLCGAYLADRETLQKPIKGLRAIITLSILGSALAQYLVARHFPANQYFRDWLSPGVIVLSVALFALLSLERDRWRIASAANRGLLGLMASASFGIYLIHPVFVMVLWRVKWLNTGLVPIAAIPLLSILFFVLSLIATLAISEVPLLKEVVAPRTTWSEWRRSLAKGAGQGTAD